MTSFCCIREKTTNQTKKKKKTLKKNCRIGRMVKKKYSGFVPEKRCGPGRELSLMSAQRRAQPCLDGSGVQ